MLSYTFIVYNKVNNLGCIIAKESIYDGSIISAKKGFSIVMNSEQ